MYFCNKFNLREFGLKKSVDSFEQMYSYMKDELDMGVIKKNFIGNALNMSTAEKGLSFLNNYFIFKKIRNVNAKTLNESIFEKMKDKIHDDIISHSSSKSKKKYRKLKIRLTLPTQ